MRDQGDYFSLCTLQEHADQNFSLCTLQEHADQNCCLDDLVLLESLLTKALAENSCPAVEWTLQASGYLILVLYGIMSVLPCFPYPLMANLLHSINFPVPRARDPDCT